MKFIGLSFVLATALAGESSHYWESHDDLSCHELATFSCDDVCHDKKKKEKAKAKKKIKLDKCVKNCRAAFFPDVQQCLQDTLHPCPLLWNRFESKENVEQSDIGPGFTLTSWKVPHWTEASIEPAIFGSGIQVNPKPNTDTSRDGANFFVLDLDEVGLSPHQGTVEWWFRPGVGSESWDHAYLLRTTDHLTNHYCGSSSDDAPEGACDPFTDVCCFATASPECCVVGTYDQFPPRSYPNVGLDFVWSGWNLPGRNKFQAALYAGPGKTASTQTSQQSFQAGTDLHLAMVWDVDGIDGTSDTMRIYVNGEVDGIFADTEDVWGGRENKFFRYFYLGTSPNSGPYDTFYSAMVGAFDNLKMWGFAKTDFSDRFQEEFPVGYCS